MNDSQGENESDMPVRVVGSAFSNSDFYYRQ